MKYEFSGIVNAKYSDDNFTHLFLKDESGYCIDLVGRLTEITYSFGKTLTIRYWIADKPTPKDKIQEGFIRELMGYVEASYEASSYSYSEYTQGTDYDTIFNIDGHNLYNELVGYDGKFVIIEIEF